LASVEGGEPGAAGLAEAVETVWPLHLVHVRSPFGEQHRRCGAGPERAELDHPDAVERPPPPGAARGRPVREVATEWMDSSVAVDNPATPQQRICDCLSGGQCHAARQPHLLERVEDLTPAPPCDPAT